MPYKLFNHARSYAWRIVEKIESFMQITAMVRTPTNDDYRELYAETLKLKLMIEFYLNEIQALLWDNPEDAPEDHLGGRG